MKPSAINTRPRPDGLVSVTCWGEREIVLVPPHDVRFGRTRACAHPECRDSWGKGYETGVAS